MNGEPKTAIFYGPNFSTELKNIFKEAKVGTTIAFEIRITGEKNMTLGVKKVKII